MIILHKIIFNYISSIFFCITFLSALSAVEEKLKPSNTNENSVIKISDLVNKRIIGSLLNVKNYNFL